MCISEATWKQMQLLARLRRLLPHGHHAAHMADAHHPPLAAAERGITTLATHLLTILAKAPNNEFHHYVQLLRAHQEYAPMVLDTLMAALPKRTKLVTKAWLRKDKS
eukprot:139857-Amphidinium_carterae.2